jgi:hypothetical protein
MTGPDPMPDAARLRRVARDVLEDTEATFAGELEAELAAARLRHAARRAADDAARQAAGAARADALAREFGGDGLAVRNRYAAGNVTLLLGLLLIAVALAAGVAAPLGLALGVAPYGAARCLGAR